MKRFFYELVLLFPIILILCLIAGCGRDETERNQATDYSVNHPAKVVTLPDGRILYCIVIAKSFSEHDHYIYYFSTNDVNTVSVNYLVPVGKTHINKTIVLDGITYKSAETNN